MNARRNVSTPDNAYPRLHLSSRQLETPTTTKPTRRCHRRSHVAHSSEDRTLTTTTPTSLGRHVWIVLAIAGLAACAEAAPNMDAETSGAATTSTSVPALAVAPAPCGEAVVPGGVDDFPEARRSDVACPAPCGEAVVPGGVDDFPEARRRDVLRRRPRHRPAEAPRPAVSRRQPPGPDTAGARRGRSGPSDTPSIRPAATGQRAQQAEMVTTTWRADRARHARQYLRTATRTIATSPAIATTAPLRQNRSSGVRARLPTAWRWGRSAHGPTK